MKTLVENATGVSKYVFADDAAVILTADKITTPNFVIGDLNSTNTTLVDNVTPPIDWEGGKYIFNNGAWSRAPQPVPQSVSRFQARAALHLAGLLESVEDVMQDQNTDMLAKLAWQDAQSFERQSPTVQALAEALSLSAEQLDELFITAAGIKA